MNDAVIVEVGNSRQGGANEVRGVGFVVASFPANAVEKLAAEGEVGNKVD